MTAGIGGLTTLAIVQCIPRRQVVFLLRFLVLLFVLSDIQAFAQQQPRIEIALNSNWKSVADDHNNNAFSGFEQLHYDDHLWKTVQVPHNWDQYEGYRRLPAGNRHGTAWYRKTFSLRQPKTGKRFFLFFEGAGSYATVFLNGIPVGTHAGGRTSFTLDVTRAILLNNRRNILSVRTDHPAGIQDLPWVDGGSSAERGFSEGSQPMGLFRPVQLVITNDVRIEPFGVHIWNDTSVNTQSAQLHTITTLKNYGLHLKHLQVQTELFTSEGKRVSAARCTAEIPGAGSLELAAELRVKRPRLWSPDDPYLYTVRTRVYSHSKLLDEVKTTCGIRWISWPVGEGHHGNQFRVNGKPVFINGVAEYEHLLGGSHAFTAEQIRSRALQIRAAGFNAFRDAHQPHNLRYMQYWDSLGILCWTQMAAHIWYDTPAFRNNFKTLLREWVRERRNSPSVVLWGLENESTLPEDFARECTEIIRDLDPTASQQRKVTTCNGGKGTDWDVPQNWTGTYGGNPLDYGKDLERQVLVGEYGAWRTLDLHTEGPFVQNGPYSEERIAQLLETKICLAEAAKANAAGHFFWLFNSHDNPGRVQSGEALRELDRIGPVNYKGLLTPWEEPLAIYYLFRASYASRLSSPMVYIALHTWPQRWLKPGMKDSITIYSNCDEVELFNDMGHHSLGKRSNHGKGTHFQWDRAKIDYNVLYAIGYVNGKPVARDTVVMQNLPKAPHFDLLYKGASVMQPAAGYNYIYRVNAGGPDYTDSRGNLWMADRPRRDRHGWGSVSWAADFPGIRPFFGSQRRTFDPVRGSLDWPLFQTFRYGREKLRFEFPLPDGEYLVELYFTEPWLGAGGGMDCSGWRLFDVAVNDQVVIRDLDIWKEAGHDGALKKSVKVKVHGGQLCISFPHIKAGEALISAIAIAGKAKSILPAPPSGGIVKSFALTGGLQLPGQPALAADRLSSWMDIGSSFSALPPELFGAEWMQVKRGQALTFILTADADVYIAPEDTITLSGPGRAGFENTQTLLRDTASRPSIIYKKRYSSGSIVTIPAGAAPDVNYTLAVQPASGIAPPYDLKKTVSYPAIPAFAASTGLKKEVLMGKERLSYLAYPGADLVFTIKVGVADIYSLTLKYHNPYGTARNLQLEMVLPDGTIIKKPELLQLVPSKEGKWDFVTATTGTMINAGTYLVHLRSADASGVSVDGLEVR